MTDLAEILALFDREQRRDIEFPGMRKDVLPGLVRFVRPAPGMSFILYSDLDETTADAVIEDQLAYFNGKELSFEWKVFAHDQPPDLVDRLVARGFQIEEPDDIMVLDVDRANPVISGRPGFTVRRLSHPEELVDVVRVLEPVWEKDFNWVYERLGTNMTIPGYLSVYVAYFGEQPACVGWVYFSPGQFGSLWGGSTLERFRGHGLYSAVLTARILEAKERGIRYLTIDAGKMSGPIVAKHGFEIITRATACEWIHMSQ
ncbi:MAG: GNAT family N-acetyltransferase [Chloroflexota bacterium]|jgi:GNAT superfamily N-acetyltransferase